MDASSSADRVEPSIGRDDMAPFMDTHTVESAAARELEGVLDHVAERVVEHGTLTEARVLEAMADASQEACPGAAAALVDWNGSEIARLRAFGIVHGVVLEVLGPLGRSVLLEQVLGTADLEYRPVTRLTSPRIGRIA